MDRLVTFYRQGLTLGKPDVKMANHIGFHLGTLYFGFDQVKSHEGKPPSAVTLWFTVDDLELTFDRLKRLGTPVRLPPTVKPWGSTLAAVYDPDGNIVGPEQRPAGKEDA